MNEKKALRKQLKTQIQKIDAKNLSEKNAKISKVFLTWWQSNQHHYDQIFAYYPMLYEPNLMPILEELNTKGFKVALPYIIGSQMSFLRFDFKTCLVRHSLGFFQPPANPKNLLSINKKTLVLVPCLALDKYYVRLGYGKGFYDRYQTYHSEGGFYLGVLWKEFFVDKLPIDPWDKPLHGVIHD